MVAANVAKATKTTVAMDEHVGGGDVGRKPTYICDINKWECHKKNRGDGGRV